MAKTDYPDDGPAFCTPVFPDRQNPVLIVVQHAEVKDQLAGLFPEDTVQFAWPGDLDLHDRYRACLVAFDVVNTVPSIAIDAFRYWFQRRVIPTLDNPMNVVFL